MEIIVSFGEIFDRGIWLEFCEVAGVNEWAINEGLATKDDTKVLTEEQAKELGLI